MAELCGEASTIAMETLARGEGLDMLAAFEQALGRCLARHRYDLNDLVSVWAMLMIGGRVIRKHCIQINRTNPDRYISPHDNHRHPYSGIDGA